jgi:hypothetical protein
LAAVAFTGCSSGNVQQARILKLSFADAHRLTREAGQHEGSIVADPRGSWPRVIAQGTKDMELRMVKTSILHWVDVRTDRDPGRARSKYRLSLAAAQDWTY